MPKPFVIVLLAALAFVAACGGGGDDERITIERIDFEGVALDAEDFVNPTIPANYPAVVAEVNGAPITGKSLAARQVMLELGRRDLPFLLEAYPEDLEEELARVDSIDPLEALIDDELQKQAAERLGVMPATSEAVEFVQTQEQQFRNPSGTVSPEDQQAVLEVQRLMGFPGEDWASDPDIVRIYQQRLGVARLHDQYCATPTPPQQTPSGVLSTNTRNDCTEFLARERENAEIVYYVRWAE